MTPCVSVSLDVAALCEVRGGAFIRVWAALADYAGFTRACCGSRVRVRLVDSHHHVRACSVFVSNLLTGPVPRSFGSLSSLNVMYVRLRAVARVALHACATRLGRIGCVSRCLLLAPPRAAHVTVRTPACPPCTYVSARGTLRRALHAWLVGWYAP